MACTGGGAIAVVSDPSAGEVFTGRTVELQAWFTVGFDDMDRSFALDAYNHLPAYYGGRKAGTLIHYGEISRELSSRFASYKPASCTVSFDNTSRVLDILETAAASQYWANREGRIYLASPATIAAGGTPHTLFRGIWREHRNTGLRRELTLSDILGSEFSDFNLEDTIPRRKIKDYYAAAPVENLDKVVPILYGKISDTNVTVTDGVTATAFLSPDLTINNIGSNWKMTSVGGGTLVYDQNTVPPNGGTAYVWIIPKRNGLGGRPLISAYNTSYVTPLGWVFTIEPVGIAAHWNKIGDEDGYRLFVADAPDFDPLGSRGSATKARYFDHDAVTIDGAYGNNFSVTINDWTFGTDALGTIPTAITTDSGTGKYAPVYVGTNAVAGAIYHTWVVAGHAITDIEELYVDGTPIFIATDEGPFLVPGYPKWTAALGATTYVTVGGHRLTVIYGKQGSVLADQAAGILPSPVPAPADGTPAPPRLAMNLCGVEDVGDSSGSTLTRAPRVIYHILEQFVIQNYLTGLWASPSTSADGVPWLNTASFQAMEAIEINRIGGEGYEAAIVLTEPITIRDFLSRSLTSFDMRFGPNKHGQVMAAHLDEFMDLASATRITDVQEILEPTDIERRLEELENRVVGDSGYRQATGGTWDTEGATYEDALAIANNRGRAAVGDRRAMYYTANDATSADVLGRALAIGKYPPTYVSMVGPLHWLRYELNDVFLDTDVDGIGAAGWTDRVLWILGMKVLLNDLTQPAQVKLFCMDIDRLLSESAVLGSSAALGAWTAESAANRRTYWFLGSSASGMFSDGAPVKRLR